MTTEPKLFQYCVQLYELMDGRARNYSDNRIYEGSLSNDFEELGITKSYYSKVVTRMRAMSCIEQLKRGGGTSRSLWALYRKPTMDLFLASDDTNEIKYKVNKEQNNEALQRVKDVQKRLTILENWAREQGAPL